MNKTRFFFLFLLLVACACTQKNEAADAVLPSEPHVQWAEAEIGAMFHFDVVNYVPDYNWREWGTHPPASVFNPSKLDTDQWLHAASGKKCGRVVLGHQSSRRNNGVAVLFHIS